MSPRVRAAAAWAQAARVRACRSAGQQASLPENGTTTRTTASFSRYLKSSEALGLHATRRVEASVHCGGRCRGPCDCRLPDRRFRRHTLDDAPDHSIRPNAALSERRWARRRFADGPSDMHRRQCGGRAFYARRRQLARLAPHRESRAGGDQIDRAGVHPRHHRIDGRRDRRHQEHGVRGCRQADAATGPRTSGGTRGLQRLRRYLRHQDVPLRHRSRLVSVEYRHPFRGGRRRSPEAVNEALHAAGQLDWHDDAFARFAFS